jgi:hypothetical protein
MPLSRCRVYSGRDYLQSSLFDAVVSVIQPFEVPFLSILPADTGSHRR